jgi:hypothetical protein
LQQTKSESLKSGGPQYYFHSVPAYIKEFLRRRGACPIVLMTPYGIAPSPLTVVGRDHKLVGGRAVRGGSEHDRIQKARAERSIGEEIRRWYNLPASQVFERIDVEVSLHPEGHFILAPTRVSYRAGRRSREIEKPLNPLSFNRRQQSTLWRRQIERVQKTAPDDWGWAMEEIERVVTDHRNPAVGRIHEADLQRTAGAFSKLGVKLGPYLVKGYDCASRFEFLDLQPYECPIEIKKRSVGFTYQMARYKPLPRAVVLCLDHDLVNVPDHIDVVELSHFVESYARR